MTAKDNNGWERWGELVLSELNRLDRDRKEYVEKMDAKMEVLSEKIDRIHDDVLTLKIKAGMWGAGASLAVAFILNILSG